MEACFYYDPATRRWVRRSADGTVEYLTAKELVQADDPYLTLLRFGGSFL